MTHDNTLNSSQPAASKEGEGHSALQSFLSDKRQKRDEILRGPLAELSALTTERHRIETAIKAIRKRIRGIEDDMMTKQERRERDLQLALEELQKASGRNMTRKELRDAIDSEFDLDELLEPAFQAKKVAKAGPGRVKLLEDR